MSLILKWTVGVIGTLVSLILISLAIYGLRRRAVNKARRIKLNDLYTDDAKPFERLKLIASPVSIRLLPKHMVVGGEAGFENSFPRLRNRNLDRNKWSKDGGNNMKTADADWDVSRAHKFLEDAVLDDVNRPPAKVKDQLTVRVSSNVEKAMGRNVPKQPDAARNNPDVVLRNHGARGVGNRRADDGDWNVNDANEFLGRDRSRPIAELPVNSQISVGRSGARKAPLLDRDAAALGDNRDTSNRGVSTFGELKTTK